MFVECIYSKRNLFVLSEQAVSFVCECGQDFKVKVFLWQTLEGQVDTS